MLGDRTTVTAILHRSGFLVHSGNLGKLLKTWNICALLLGAIFLRGSVSAQPAAAGEIFVVDSHAGSNAAGALFKVNASTGMRSLISDFGAGAQGPLGFAPWAL